MGTETRKITLEAVYDESDLMSDYFDNNHRLKQWNVADFTGKMVTENILRKAMSNLPDWLHHFVWNYQKGEKYSMSDHPYGQLLAEGKTPDGKEIYLTNSMKHMVNVRFIITLGWFNDPADAKVPIPSWAEFEQILQGRIAGKATIVIPDIPEAIVTPILPPNDHVRIVKDEQEATKLPKGDNPHMSLLLYT